LFHENAAARVGETRRGETGQQRIQEGDKRGLGYCGRISRRYDRGEYIAKAEVGVADNVGIGVRKLASVLNSKLAAAALLIVAGKLRDAFQNNRMLPAGQVHQIQRIGAIDSAVYLRQIKPQPPAV
jgi:hypothetical protein